VFTSNAGRLGKKLRKGIWPHSGWVKKTQEKDQVTTIRRNSIASGRRKEIIPGQRERRPAGRWRSPATPTTILPGINREKNLK
jgi:hypothetical protein